MDKIDELLYMSQKNQLKMKFEMLEIREDSLKILSCIEQSLYLCFFSYSGAQIHWNATTRLE